jgi:hypothetical protein
MEPEVPVPHTLIPILSQTNPVHATISILILSTHLYLGLFLLVFPPITYMHSSSAPFVLHDLPISSSLIDHSNYIWWRVKVKVMNLPTMQPSPTSCHFISLWSKYSPQHPVLKHSLCFSYNVRDQVSHPYRTTGKIIVLYTYILIFMLLGSRLLILFFKTQSA